MRFTREHEEVACSARSTASSSSLVPSFLHHRRRRWPPRQPTFSQRRRNFAHKTRNMPVKLSASPPSPPASEPTPTTSTSMATVLPTVPQQTSGTTQRDGSRSDTSVAEKPKAPEISSDGSVCVTLDCPSIGDVMAARLAMSVLGHMLYLKSQVPL